MKQSQKRSVLPVYSIALVWLLFTLFHGLSGFSDYLQAALLSALVFVVLTLVLPKPKAEPQDKAEPQKAQPVKEEAKEAPASDPEVAALQKERDRAISEMRRLNDNIQDETISRQIDHLEFTTGKIFSAVLEKPEKKSQISRFLSYYLPTTIKLLHAYDRMSAVGIDGSNITSTKQKVEEMLGTIEKAFDKQLDALYSDEALDISTDIKVLENLMAQEGLGDNVLHAEGH